ncbi:MAG: hypothetical protein AAFR31_06470 [Cyanobacteria bacterium J06627_8]
MSRSALIHGLRPAYWMASPLTGIGVPTDITWDIIANRRRRFPPQSCRSFLKGGHCLKYVSVEARLNRKSKV